MIKNKKLTIIGAAALALACTAGATVISASAEPTVQDYASFAMLDGASVRVKKDEKAIRFTTRISREDLHTAVGGAGNLANAKIVTLVTPTRYLDEAGLTDFDKDTDILMQPIEIKAENYVKYEANINETDTSITKSDYYYFNACLYNVEEANLSRKFSAKSYLLVGDTVVDYTAFDYEKNSRDIWYIADQAKQNSVLYPNTEATDEAYDYLDALSATFDVKVDDYTKTVKRGERLAWYADELKTNLGNKEDVANLTYSYYRGLNDYDDTQSVTSDLTLTAKYDIINFTDNGDDTYSVSTGHTLNAGAKIVIPETINGGSVTTVANSAFYDNQNLTHVYLPDSVTEIKASAFGLCKNLQFIDLGGVSKLGGKAEAFGDDVNDAQVNAFLACNALRTVVVKGDLTVTRQTFVKGGHSTDFGFNVFSESASATVNMHASDTLWTANSKKYNYTENADFCQTWCWNNNKTDVVLNTNEHTDGENGYCAHEKCNSVTDASKAVLYAWDDTSKTYYVSDGTKTTSESIEVMATYNDGIHGEKPVTYVGANAFKTGEYAGNANITHVYLPDSITEIKANAFWFCSNLLLIDLGGVSELSAESQFTGCVALARVIIKDNLTIAGKSFNSSQPKTGFSIYSEAADATVTGATTDNAGGLWTANSKIYCCDETLPVCQSWQWNEDKTDVVVAEHSERNDGYCEHCFTKLDATKAVNYAWDDTTKTYYVEDDGSITSATVYVAGTFNDGEHDLADVTYIGASAFSENQNITHVYLDDKITEIKASAFSLCKSLQFIDLGGVSKLGGKLVSAGDDVNDAQVNAFLACNALRTVVVKGNLTVTRQTFVKGSQEGDYGFDIYTEAASATITLYSFDALTANSKIYYYSENQPTTAGNYWHYVNGEVKAWDTVA